MYYRIIRGALISSSVVDGTNPITLGEHKQGTKQLLSAAKESPVKGAPLQSADRHDLEPRPEGHLSPHCYYVWQE